MKKAFYLLIPILIMTLPASAQKDNPEKTEKDHALRILTIEPAIGLEPMSDLVLSNLIHLNITKHLGITSYTSYSYNNAAQRNFNFINTNYNYTITQKFGIGTSFYTKHSSHTFSLMAGIRYNAFKETLENPDLENVSASVSSFSPDPGFLYNLKIGRKKVFFSYRMFVPLYPYPFKNTDSWSISDNVYNFSMEFGLGIRLKRKTSISD